MELQHMAEDWISISEFARRRSCSHTAVQKAIESKRVPETAVRRNEAGRLAAIEFHAAMAAWDRNTDIDQAARNGKVLGATAAPAAIPVAMDTSLRALGGAAIAPAIEGQGSTPAAKGEGGAAGPDGSPAAAGDLVVAFAPAGGVQPSAAAPQASTTDLDQQAYYSHRAKREEFQAKQAELDYLESLGRVISTEEFERLSMRRYRAIRDTLLNIPDRVATILAAERDPARVHATLTTELKRVLNELHDAAAAEAAGGPSERVAA
jgi:hypothetical protein